MKGSADAQRTIDLIYSEGSAIFQNSNCSNVSAKLTSAKHLLTNDTSLQAGLDNRPSARLDPEDRGLQLPEMPFLRGEAKRSQLELFPLLGDEAGRLRLVLPPGARRGG